MLVRLTLRRAQNDSYNRMNLIGEAEKKYIQLFINFILLFCFYIILLLYYMLLNKCNQIIHLNMLILYIDKIYIIYFVLIICIKICTILLNKRN